MHGTLSISLQCTCNVPAWNTGPAPSVMGMPVIITAYFIDFTLRNKTLGAQIQPVVANSCNHDPTMCEPSDGAMGGCILLRVICRVGKEAREKPMLYPINALNNNPIEVGVEELRVLDQNQPSSLEDFLPAMGEVCPRCCLAQCGFDLVLNLIR